VKTGYSPRYCDSSTPVQKPFLASPAKEKENRLKLLKSGDLDTWM